MRNEMWCSICTQQMPMEHNHFTNLDKAYYYMHKALEDHNKIKALFLPEETKANEKITQAEKEQAIKDEHNKITFPPGVRAYNG